MYEVLAVTLSRYDNYVDPANHAFQSRFCLYSSCFADIAIRMWSAQVGGAGFAITSNGMKAERPTASIRALLKLAGKPFV